MRVFVLIGCLLLSTNVYAQVNFADTAPERIVIQAAAEVPIGEHLVYDVRWFGIPIGDGEITIRHGANRAEYEIEARATSNPFLSRFYPVQDVLKSTLTPDFRVINSEKNLKEGRYRAHERVDYDYDQDRGFWQSFLSGSKQEIPLEGVHQDVLSLFYWIRLQPFEVGKSLSERLCTDEKTYRLTTHILRAERIEIRNLGTFDTVVLEPQADFKGVLVDRGKAWIYLTADERRLPIKIVMKTPLGPVVGILKEGL